MTVINKIVIIVLFLLLNIQSVTGQTVNKNSSCTKSKLLKDLNKFVSFCNTKFSPSQYFQSDTPCIKCITKDFKGFKLNKAEKFEQRYEIDFQKNYSKRSVNFLNIFLSLNYLNKSSSRISFYPYSTNINFTTKCILDVLGSPIGHNADSTSIFWKTTSNNVFELRLKENNLIFYTNDYEYKYYDFKNKKEVTTRIADMIIENSLPKLPVISEFLRDLKLNDYFYEDSIFSDEEKKEFKIDWIKLCRLDFDKLINEFGPQKRDIKELNSAIDSFKNQCFKNHNLFRGSNIKIYNWTHETSRANNIAFSIDCFNRPSDTDINESMKKARIKNTMSFLIEKSSSNLFLQSISKLLMDSIDSIEIDKEKQINIYKDNYHIYINYQSLWLNAFIIMPKAYHKE